MSNISKSLTFLPRGGFLIRTSIGNIQFAIPPETIKDTMNSADGVPSIFVVPQYMFDLEKGFALAELEFPIYYNFYIKKNKIKVVCTDNQRKRLKIVINEALFGPRYLELKNEYVDGENTPGFPDLLAEIKHFKNLSALGRPLVLDDVVEFYVYDQSGRATLGNIYVQHDQLYNYYIYDHGKEVICIDRNLPVSGTVKPVEEEDRLFMPPIFGITTLGSGHGFDPESKTSGLIIWVNRRGIMIDPPVNSTENLLQLGVSPKLIDSIILTHCHADHDAGTLQKLYQEGRVSIYTTATIFKSFMRKSSALTEINENHLRRMVNFFPVIIGKANKINGGDFYFNYTLHSIPTISIQVKIFGKSMIFSSDTLYDPDYVKKLYQKGIVSKGRMEVLNNFPWDQTVLFHEAGMPPLHTPLDILCKLPEDVRKRIYLVHVDQNVVPAGSGLRIAPTGLANTLELVSKPLPYDDVVEILDVISHVNFMQDMRISKIRQLLLVIQKEIFRAGEIIFNEYDYGEKFYIVMRGKVDIVQKGKILTTYSDSDYFGEKSIFCTEVRTATAIARTDINLLSVNKDDMLAFLRGTEGEKLLRYISSCQDAELRKLFAVNRVLNNLTPTQQTELHGIIRPLIGILPPGTVIVDENTIMDYCYLIRAGEVDIFKNNKLQDTIHKGDMIGIKGMYAEMENVEFTFIAKNKVTLYSINRTSFREYLERTPGVYVKMFHGKY